MQFRTKKTLIINGIRSRSGGSIVHIRNLLSFLDKDQRFEKVVLISNQTLRNATLDYHWLEKKKFKSFDGLPTISIFWEIFLMKFFIKDFSSNSILLNLDGSYFGPYMIPTVTMSRDMLSFEPSLLQLYFPSKLWLRNCIIKWIQIRAFKKSDGIIFLTEYARDNILKHMKVSKRNRVINHGFNHVQANIKSNFNINETIKLVYVSPIWKFKDHITVLKSVELLLKQGINCEIKFIGERTKEHKFVKIVDKFLRKNENFSGKVIFTGNLTHRDVLTEIVKSDIFIFASLCENMPNTLIEAMGIGMPIVCANTGPMPEVLKESGLLYKPSNPEDLAFCLCKLISDFELRKKLAKLAILNAKKYDWEITSHQTITFLEDVMNEDLKGRL
tara:strand:- start:70 stop:1230 length:1161 start_codon:yes stop_codon:yes gene_type:complete